MMLEQKSQTGIHRSRNLEKTMTDSESIKSAIRSAYQARCRGDVDATLAYFADDIVFAFNGKGTGLPDMAAPIRGMAAYRSALIGLIEGFQLNDWKEISLVVEGDRAALHWRANVKFAASGRSELFDVFDFITCRDGKFVEFRQSTDTAQMKTLFAQ
jgi:ketosteroid isomerase-like protein